MRNLRPPRAVEPWGGGGGYIVLLLLVFEMLFIITTHHILKILNFTVPTYTLQKYTYVGNRYACACRTL
jgi:hypothetical protein